MLFCNSGKGVPVSVYKCFLMWRQRPEGKLHQDTLEGMLQDHAFLLGGHTMELKVKGQESRLFSSEPLDKSVYAERSDDLRPVISFNVISWLGL